MANRLVVLISGNGSNLQAIIDATASGVLPDTAIPLVISNRKDAYGLQRARDTDINTTYHNLIPYSKRFPDPTAKYGQEAREAYDADLAEKILAVKPAMVVCAGWMHIFGNKFLAPLEQAKIPVLNLHPALPGEYDGASAIERAFSDFRKGKIQHTGVMIHYVIREIDRGRPIIIQEVEIKPEDELEDLQERIHAVEHDIIIEGIKVARSECLRRQ